MSQPNVQHAPSTYDEAYAQYLAADYDACLSTLAALPCTPQVALLQSRALTRAERAAEAHLLLLNYEPDQATQSEHFTALGVAHMRLGDFAAAKEALTQGRRLAKTLKARSENGYARASLAWARQDAKAAESALRAIPSLHLQPAVYAMRGWIESMREHYHDAAKFFSTGLQQSISRSHPDMYVRTRLAWSLAFLAREIYLPGALSLIEEATESIKWTPILQPARFQIARDVAWLRAIDGDFHGAIRGIRGAMELAPSPAWKVSAYCDRAQLALSLHEPNSARDWIESALDIADHVVWNDTHGEEREALLLLAQMLGPYNTLRARRLLDVYNSLGPTSIDIAYSRDVRAKAFEYFVVGSVEHAAGNGSGAAEHYHKAFSIYRRIGFEWRAMLTALARGELSRRVDYYDYVDQQLQRFPNSWLQQLISAKLDALRVCKEVRLTPTQIEIVALVCQGKRDKEIAEELQRSLPTIRDHQKEIRKRTGTRTRTELVAFCAKNGII